MQAPVLNMLFRDMSVSDADFQRMVRFIQDNYGIDLSKKKQLITSRLSHSLRERGYPDFSAFLDHLLKKQDPADLELVLNKLTTNYTFFMREPDHFTFFRDVILPELSRRHQKDRVLSIWSAGCSSGEEPYTLSIYLKEFFGPQASQWDTRILATDISQQALSKAKGGQYKLPADMPGEWLKRYFVKDDTTCLYTAAPQLKQNVIFRTFNLMDPIHFRLKFDVIFCRNVMIYFDQATRDALVPALLRCPASNRIPVYQSLRISGADPAVPNGRPGGLSKASTRDAPVNLAKKGSGTYADHKSKDPRFGRGRFRCGTQRHHPGAFRLTPHRGGGVCSQCHGCKDKTPAPLP